MKLLAAIAIAAAPEAPEMPADVREQAHIDGVWVERDAFQPVENERRRAAFEQNKRKLLFREPQSGPPTRQQHECAMRRRETASVAVAEVPIDAEAVAERMRALAAPEEAPAAAMPASTATVYHLRRPG